MAVYDLVVETMLAAPGAHWCALRTNWPPAGAYLAELTGGRYTSTKVDSDLNVLVVAPDSPGGRGGTRTALKGTQDQLYLALRLALMDLLFPSTRPPLFLDDPFVKFDDGRRKAALNSASESPGTDR